MSTNTNLNTVLTRYHQTQSAIADAEARAASMKSGLVEYLQNYLRACSDRINGLKHEDSRARWLAFWQTEYTKTQQALAAIEGDL